MNVNGVITRSADRKRGLRVESRISLPCAFAGSGSAHDDHPLLRHMDFFITDQEFDLFRQLIYKIAGISLADSKKMLLLGRLQRRLRHHHLQNFSQYYQMVSGGRNAEELQIMVDLLTTNETFFFREPKHFDFLRTEVLACRRTSSTFRIWSAASSSGEEAYSMAMLLAEYLSNAVWEIFASDISTQMLNKARSGQYTLDRTEGIPPALLAKYCRRSPGSLEIAPELRRRVNFQQINLTQPIPASVGDFEVIFLRNVMIYFDTETKRKVIANLLPRLKSGGYLVVGHSESLHGISDAIKTVRPTIYQKP